MSTLHTGREFKRNKFNRKKVEENEEAERVGVGEAEKKNKKEKIKGSCMGLDMFKFIFSYSSTQHIGQLAER